jgi:hypothetical protein
MHVKEIYVIFIHLFDSGLLLIINIYGLGVVISTIKKFMGGDANVKLCIQHFFLSPGLSPTLLGNLHKKM